MEREKIRIQENEKEPYAVLTEIPPEKEIFDFYEKVQNRNVGIYLNNFILQAEMAESKIGGALIHGYSKNVILLTVGKNRLLELGLDLDNMTFGQLKQERPDFLDPMFDNIVTLVKFGKIMDIPELKF